MKLYSLNTASVSARTYLDKPFQLLCEIDNDIAFFQF